jgi:hypothetical protein
MVAKMTPKWQLADFRNGSSTAYLNGEIITHENQTLVRFTVRPNYTFTILFFLGPLCLITTDRNSLLGEGTFFIVVPVVMYFAGVISKRTLKNRFVQTFKLKELP